MDVDINRHVVIVGAGHAGGSAAVFLRQFGHAGPVTLIGDEPSPPYQRPPLSKAWLKGEADAESLLLKPASWYADNDVDLRLSTVVDGFDPARGLVRLSPGGEIGFDALILASGARARRLTIPGILASGARARRLTIPGADAYGVLALRHMADAETLKTSLGRGRRLAVIGGGYVGLEAAASARVGRRGGGGRTRSAPPGARRQRGLVRLLLRSAYRARRRVRTRRAGRTLRDADGYTAMRHQREVGGGEFDKVATTITGGASSTTAMGASTKPPSSKRPSRNSPRRGLIETLGPRVRRSRKPGAVARDRSNSADPPASASKRRL